MEKFGLVLIFLACFLIIGLTADNVHVTTTTTTLAPTPTTTLAPTPTTTTLAPTTTTTDPSILCGYHNSSCEECVRADKKCYYCYKRKSCEHYKYDKLVPVADCGSLEDMAWGTCVVNLEVLIISLSVVGGVLLISLIICCCCCCRKYRRGIWAKDQAKWEQQREELKMRTDDRKKERQSRTDEIRRKYGLMKDDNPYQRFEA